MQIRVQNWVKPRYVPLVMAGLLLIIAASRIIHFATLNPDVDEVWSIWQTFGTPRQILQWTPYDWPPTYYLILGGWKELVGIYPFALRMLSLLAFLPGVVFFFRFARRLFNENAAWLIVIAYAALSYTVSRSVSIRGYALAIMLTPLAMWLMLRYFAKSTWVRGISLGCSMAALFSIHLTTVFVFALMGLFTLVMAPRKLWRWWLPGLVAVIVDWPFIFNKTQIAGNILTSLKASNYVTVLPPFFTALWEVFSRFSGYMVGFWSITAVIATVLILYKRIKLRQTLTILVWLSVLPVVIYIVSIISLPLFGNHTLWSELFVVGAWIGWGLSLLPTPLATASALLMVFVMFYPALNSYLIYPRPFIENFTWLTREVHHGDVMIIDPYCKCGDPEMWNYFTRAYFPDGLQYVNDPQLARRVWYVQREGSQDQELLSKVNQRRLARNFVGPWDFLVRLYEAAPNPIGTLFDNHMVFYGADLLITQPVVMHEGEKLKVQLWWKATTPPKLDYSIGLYLMTKDGTKLLAQTDGPLQVIDPVGINIGTSVLNTSQMTPGQLYIDQREITVPDPTKTDEYALYLVVYDSASGEKVSAPGVNRDKLLFIQSVPVKAW